MSAIVLATINAKWIHPSLALRLLKANLGPLEDRAVILEFALRQPLSEKLEPILAAKPRILGLSVSIWNHQATLELLRELKQTWDAEQEHAQPGAEARRPLIILGGPEVSHLPEASEIIGYADWVVRGEGELVFRDLCGLLLEGDGSSLSEARAIPPSVKAVTGKIIEAWPVDMAAIDPGYRLYTQEDLDRKLTYIEASRGCPFGCAFCLSALDPGVREFPLDRFLKEMEQLIARGGRSFKLLDRTFNLNIPRARSIMEFFLQQAARKKTMYVHFEMVPSRFPAELRALLTRFPPDSLRLELGIQTFNAKTAALINRPSDPAAELECLGFLRDKTNAIVHADLIAGLPGEDMASFAEGFDRLWNAGPTEIQLGILKRLPGTPLAQQKDPCARYAPDPPYTVLETAALTANELERIGNFARFWELIVNRGAFPDLGPALFPEGAAVFDRFMALSDWLRERFGRNWGIERQELRQALEAWTAVS